MTDLYNRKLISFEQAEGMEPIPQQMKPKEISPQLRSTMWAALYPTINSIDVGVMSVRTEVDEPWRSIMKNHHVHRRHLPVDEYNPRFNSVVPLLKSIIFEGDYIEFFGFLEWLLRLRGCPPQWTNIINRVLEHTRAAYRVVDQDTIAPYSSEAEATALSSAMTDIRSAGFVGALQHLRAATGFATNGQWADSVRESVHAVEASARMLVPGTNELGPALTALEKSEVIHAALKRGFGAIYGFTSNEQGIRHPLVDDPKARVGEDEALFMLGACAAFISYLVKKGRAAGLVSS